MITELADSLYNVISDLNIKITHDLYTPSLKVHFENLRVSITQFKQDPKQLYKELFEPWCEIDVKRVYQLVNTLLSKDGQWVNDSIALLPEIAEVINELCIIADEIEQRRFELVNDLNEPSDTPEPLRLPDGLNTDRVKKYFARAVEVGYMKLTATGYKWEFGGKRGALARLGYFLYKTLCPTNTEQIPQQAVNRLFSVNRIDSAIAQVHNAKKPQKWRAEIDKLFND